MEDFIVFFGRSFQKEIYRFVPHSSRDFTQMLTGDTCWDIISTGPQAKGDSVIEAGPNFMLLTTMMDCLPCNHQTSAKSTVNQLTAYLFPYLPVKWLLLVTVCQ